MHERVYDEFIEKARARAEKRIVGDPFKGGVEQGPQVKHWQLYHATILLQSIFEFNL